MSWPRTLVTLRHSWPSAYKMWVGAETREGNRRGCVCSRVPLKHWNEVCGVGSWLGSEEDSGNLTFLECKMAQVWAPFLFLEVLLLVLCVFHSSVRISLDSGNPNLAQTSCLLCKQLPGHLRPYMSVQGWKLKWYTLARQDWQDMWVSAIQMLLPLLLKSGTFGCAELFRVFGA